ncbi:ATP-binding protein [Desulfosediminicola flagellatus]|uniref:ATP-binding protein n=1 Tax=Desulfosediminicola flagellatus TaxID=2569541 RepID=UPI0010AD98F0|nr:ATP-binding protein [Desulfosediminicola flagellatus]
MKEIVILSGKGGVGKSSIAASLGVILARKYTVVLADTDVDAPNLNLVLGAKLRNSEEIAASSKACIDYDKCIGCMMCKDVCKFSSICGADKPVIIPYSCEGCGACSLICPEKAIEIHDVVNGQLNIFDTVNMLLVTGELHIGGSSSGHIVDIVKKRARLEATNSHAEILLTDGPPGIGCPVIASLKGADYVILVTEPTPAALNDLKRVVEVVKHFKIPLGITLNRSDIHLESQRAIRQFADENGYFILSEIPYDNSMPMAVANAQPVISAYPSAPGSLALQTLAEVLSEKITEQV